jgi:hypothetical protein
MRLPRTSVRILALAPALVLAALLAGCSSGPPVLAKVGDRSITVDDFTDVASRSQAQYPGGADSARTALLEDMVKRELLIGEAVKRGLVSPEVRARALRQAQEQIALRALVQQVAPRDVPVSDAEVEALYRARDHEAHTLVVFTPDRAACEQALDEIKHGADFGATADRYNTTGMTPKGGDLGFLAPGTLMPALDAAMGGGAVGQVLGPIESPNDGWFLVKVLARRPRKQEPFEQVREMLRQGLRQGKQRVLLNRVQHDLLAQYHVTLDPKGTEALFRRYNAPKDTMMVGTSRMAVPAAPTPEESRQELLRYDGADGKPVHYTLGDALGDLRDGTKVQPNFSVMPMIEQWLKNMALQRVAVVETQRRHLVEEPALARQARAQAENALLQTAYEMLVLGPATIGPEDVRAAYLRHAAQLLGKDGAPIEYAKLDPNIQQALQSEAVEFARERKLKQVTDSLQASVKPKLYQDRLKKIVWPVPPASPDK